MDSGARGPQMIVVPHGAFAMGARDGDEEAEASERPRRNVRFDRGFALSVHEVTVAEFGRFIAATGYETRAERRGYSMAYDERSGNFIRRSGVDWRSDYAGARAGGDAPVLHVSARDAQAYADWLARESGQRYRLPSEAEFEYALRAGRDGRYPWGNQGPAARAGNFTGALDRSPGGRSWSNAFAGYGDGSWGPAPVGRYAVNPWGVHDLAGNVSEWVADCWHDSYRRAPEGGSAWVNPGCRTQVIRGGSWASSPAQTRASWRAPAQVDTTNARIGFRVVREI
jgi:formylglycine-generating enzyme required for sulfatase activity